MIKITKKQRNPYILDFAYHATSDKNLISIKKEGLIPGFKEKYTRADGDIYVISKYFYNNKQPIYFVDTPNLNRLPQTVKNWFKNSNYNVWLKVDVSKFNQIPDIQMLVVDYDFYPFGKELHGGENIKNKNLQKLLKKYDYEIPFSELQENEELMSELILLTNTFCINEIISPSYIKYISEFQL